MLRWQEVGKRVPERALTVPAALARKERRLGPTEATTFEPYLGSASIDPNLNWETERHDAEVRLKRQSAVHVEMLGLVELEDPPARAWNRKDGIDLTPLSGGIVEGRSSPVSSR
jgi:hypothetical protein